MLRASSKLLIRLRPLSCIGRALPALSPAQKPIFLAISLPELRFSFPSSEKIHTQRDAINESTRENVSYTLDSRTLHSSPEWLNFVESLRSRGYFDQQWPTLSSDDDDEFSKAHELPEEFLRAAKACLSFARDRRQLLSSLSRKDIEIIVENGSAFLFKNGAKSMSRLESFLSSSGCGYVPESDRATTVDLMRYLLSYASSHLHASDFISVIGKPMETSVRNLLNELTHVVGTVETILSTSPPNQFQETLEHSPRPRGKSIEMKKGDWICPKCTFMNFARNLKCLECNEARPKRQFSSGDWECPQCYYFNFERNGACLKCDCKRPHVESASENQSSHIPNQTLNKTNSYDPETESRLAANAEKADRWFRKVSQMDSADMSSAVADEDFPEIMPLRKGVSRFVVSNKKTPLERRLENAKYNRNLGNDGSAEVQNNSQAGAFGGTQTEDSQSQTSITQRLDRIHGRSSSISEKNDSSLENHYSNSSGNERRFPLQSRQGFSDNRDYTGYDSFEKFPANMPVQPQNYNLEGQGVSHSNDYIRNSASNHENHRTNRDSASNSWNESRVDATIGSSTPESSKLGTSAADSGVWKKDDGYGYGSPTRSPQLAVKSLEGSLVTEPDPLDMSEEAKTQRWFRRVAQIKDISELSQIPDEDFPSIMPMRKGVNRFVVSKRKTPLERRLTSQQYRRSLPVVRSDTGEDKE